MRNLLTIFTLLIAVTVLGTCVAFGQFTWTRYVGNPVLAGVDGTWNTHVFDPCVLYNTDSVRYEMWFNATSGFQSESYGHPYTIGFAISKDGVNWTIYPSIVLFPDSGKWDNYTADLPEVIRENGEYKMWYSSYKDNTSVGYIGYATSSDGIHWTKYAGNPIFGPGTAAWESGGPMGCSVMPIQGGYKMWYAACNADYSLAKIGYATSADGINWMRDTLNNPILSEGVPGQWDSTIVTNPNVLHISNFYYMWYCSNGIGPGTPDKSGLAVSSDGITNWTKYAANPVLVPSSNEIRTWVETVLLVGDTIHMWYDGWKKPPFEMNHWTISYATSPLAPVGIIDKNPVEPQCFILDQNYPNPFNPMTTILYQIPKKNHVILKVFDVMGREVATLVNEQKPAGAYTIQFDGSGLTSGVYFYRLKTDSFIDTKKLILLK
jgi:beta-1,2-mannobiose phosphorylase / 1,2-beta-oligomannan phosphorylase